jgi:hypothetical protein
VEQGPSFLAHRSGDAVAVAVRDVEPGKAVVRYLDEAPSPAEHDLGVNGVGKHLRFIARRCCLSSAFSLLTCRAASVSLAPSLPTRQDRCR